MKQFAIQKSLIILTILLINIYQIQCVQQEQSKWAVCVINIICYFNIQIQNTIF
ncbi:hypothetical protein IMG5_140020 [Ichthyophthirius multifiliis]|uniref:Transmembrane protein n=1 Tax=Ichthyophthirius multifiliis TaxID=5932 RepID=G0QXA0_ICHMU|nr:hypothetical protein IMG5_140020 [Ichthyophthirius multifiliis]EGR30152.1 hypothetical protein IMG5_140020 [Ichthyophthirius multifiliis]|eukprot:XP_004031388.1 hypothetical protein IMG5_140020 [Ichthyophthirius multifiliis]